MATRRANSVARWSGIAHFAAQHLLHRWLESILIVLGIAMGVGVFTAMQAHMRFNQVASNDVLHASPALMSIRVFPQRLDPSVFDDLGVPAIRLGSGIGELVRFELGDMIALKGTLPGIGNLFADEWPTNESLTDVDGTSLGPFDTLVARDEAPKLRLASVTPDSPALVRERFLAGSTFSWDDMTRNRRLLVLEAESARTLFPSAPLEDVVGRTLTVGFDSNATVWTIIGVVESGRSTDGLRAYIPLGTSNFETYRQLYLLPSEGWSIPDLIREVQAYLNQVYPPGSVQVREPPLSTDNAWVVSMLTLSGLALLIAAMSILNLFLARVLRRQRYTGMSVALGGSRSILFWQIASEAVLLGVLGSVVGVVLSAGLTRILDSFLRMQSAAYNPSTDVVLRVGIGWYDAVAGFGLGLLISLLFGLYPAWLGAHQDPGEALRTE